MHIVIDVTKYVTHRTAEEIKQQCVLRLWCWCDTLPYCNFFTEISKC